VAAAAAERKRQREDLAKLRGGVKKEEPSKATPAPDEDDDDDEEDANEHSETDEDKEEEITSGGVSGKREREKVDYIALGYMRSRLHTLEEALSVEQQLKRLNLLDGGKATAPTVTDGHDLNLDNDASHQINGIGDSDSDDNDDNYDKREDASTTSTLTPTSSVPSSPLLRTTGYGGRSENSSPVCDTAASSSDESDGEEDESARRHENGNDSASASDGIHSPTLSPRSRRSATSVALQDRS
jgi:hypothetical protein